MKKIYFAILVLAGISNVANAQQSMKYRRSSLTNVLIENEGLGKSRDMVVKAYEANPFPDKYNNHDIKDKKFNVSKMTVTDSDMMLSGFLKDTLSTPKDILGATFKLKTLRYLKADSSVAVVVPSQREMFQIRLDKYIREKDVAKQLVSTWFNRTPDGNMNWDLIKERGMYSASASDMETAQMVGDMSNFLFDFDLIGNTFVVFNDMEFYENEPVARLLRDEAKIAAMKKLAGMPAPVVAKTMAAIDTLYVKTKEGYTVKCNTYLYQLDWNEDVANKYKQYFFNDNVDKVKAWDTTSIIKLKFVGKTVSGSIVTFKIGEKRTEEQIITLQVQRTIDNALAKLQKENIVFRPVTQISSVGPLTAKVGLKEGIEAKQSFDVLQLETDSKGIPKWVTIGKVKVDKKAPVWDNRMGAEPALDEQGQPIPVLEFTTFSGGKKVDPSMHFLRSSK